MEKSKKKNKMKKMKSLPEDVIISILVKLQVKPLMRFRCVCKSWYHLIKSPHFIEMHQLSAQNKKNECILINQRVFENIYFKTELSFYSYESLNEIPPHLKVPHFNGNDIFEVSWPCNGLLLCVSGARFSDFLNPDNFRSISVLFNPATRESKLLPPSPFHVTRERLWVSLIGLGFDSNQNNYKAVTIKYKDTAEIYNLSSNSWRQVEHDMPYICYNRAGVPFNGALHWPAKRNESNIILSFDVSTEVFQDINLPEDVAHNGHHTPGTVTLLNDCLAVFTLNNVCDVWVMKEGSWTKQISIGPIRPIRPILSMNNNYIISHLFWKNEALLFHDYGLGQGKLKLWALNTHELTETRIVSQNCQQVMLYKESLVSLN